MTDKPEGGAGMRAKLKLPDPLLLTRADVAALLRTTPEALRKAEAATLTPRAAHIPGLGLRYRRADIEAWIDEQFKERPSPGDPPSPHR